MYKNLFLAGPMRNFMPIIWTRLTKEHNSSISPVEGNEFSAFKGAGLIAECLNGRQDYWLSNDEMITLNLDKVYTKTRVKK